MSVVQFPRATAITLLVSVVMCVASFSHATESMLPTGFLGDWCVTKSDERNTPPPWNYIAYRKKVVGAVQERPYD